ncbi:MAG: metallophosphoesterase [Planctomycetaceae bacterium]|nr:metallophosphoesterase [Planctomycetaceae bacterium]
MRNWLHALSVVLIFSTALNAAPDVAPQEKPPEDLPDTKESAKLPPLMPAVVTGTVTLDGKPAAGIRVTDGVGFVTTDKDGRYSITLAPDPMIPYTPARTISVCWPANTWPVKNTKTGRWSWWVRLKDIAQAVPGKPAPQEAKDVNFALVSVKQTLPVCVSFGTDAHDNFSRAHNFMWIDEAAEAGKHVDVAVDGGDMGYIGFGNANDAYTAISKFADQSPVMMLHLAGNHDVVGIHSRWWKVPHELSGNGAFTKYLNPVRWSFDMAGVHFVGLDWALEDEKGHIQLGVSNSALDWFEKDLAAQPKGTPIYLLIHQQWSPHQRFYDLLDKYGVRLTLGGHSHRNMYLNDAPPKPGQVQHWTKMSEYTLLYVHKDGNFDFVDRCIYEGFRKYWDQHWGHHGRACALFHEWPQADPQFKGAHKGVKNVTLTSEAKSLEPLGEETFDVRIGARGAGGKAATRWGVRITGSDGAVQTVIYDIKKQRLDMMGLETYFNPIVPPRGGVKPLTPEEAANEGSQPEWVEMRLLVMPDRVRLLVNGRLHYQKYVKVGKASKIEYFAEDGAAEFGRVDVWSHPWPNYKPRPCANSG